jgi:hypothetical protein
MAAPELGFAELCSTTPLPARETVQLSANEHQPIE